MSSNRLKLDQLSDELIIKIFNYLTYDDLLIVRLSNQKLYTIVLMTIENKCIIIKDNLKFFIPNFRLLESNYLNLNNCLIGQSISQFKFNYDLHRFIQKLILKNPPRLFNMTTGFDNLIHFEIVSNVYIRKPFKPIELDLPNLKTLNLFFKNNLEIHFKLNLIRLYTLASNIKLTFLDTKIKSTIRELSVSTMDGVEEYINLKKLKCVTFTYESDALKKLKYLEEFEFFEYLEDGTKTANYLIQINLVNTRIKIYYKSLMFSLNNLINKELNRISIDTLNDDDIQIYDLNLRILAKPLINYNLNISKFDLLSLSVIQKLNNLTSLTINNQVRSDQKWRIVLRQAPKLMKLNLNCNINQDFLKIIPKLCPLIVDLTIAYPNYPDFILELKYLNALNFGVFFSYDFFSKMLNLKNLTEIKLAEIFLIKFDDKNVICYVDKIPVNFDTRESFINTVKFYRGWLDLFDYDLDAYMKRFKTK